MKKIIILILVIMLILGVITTIFFVKQKSYDKHLQETGYTERLEPLVYKNNKTLEIAEISIFELKI